MVKLFPKKEFTIETSLTKEQVIEKLNSLKRPQERGFWNSLPDVFAYQKAPEKTYYIVKLKRNLFTIYLDFNIRGLGFITDFYRKMAEVGSSPRIEGVIYEDENTVVINMVIKPPEVYSLYFLGLLILGGFIGLIQLLIAVIKGEYQDILAILIFILFFMLIGAIFYAGMDFYITNYANKMKPFLTNLFEAE